MKKKSETILGLMGIVVIITLFSGAGSAAPGDLLAFVTVPVPSSSGIGIGIDYDGTSILYTNYLDPTVYKTDFSGANLGSIPLINPDGSRFSGGLNAIAYNFNDNMLYGGGWGSTNLYKTDLATGATTLVKADAVPPAFNFIDGLAWDPTDNTFWMSDDVQCNVEHLDVLGNDIGGFDGCSVTALQNSGLAVSLNGFLWYGTDGAGEIHRLDTSVDPPIDMGWFSSPGGRDGDMVCGPKYTKPDGSMVETLLSKDAYDNTFAIIEVADGTCITPAEPQLEASCVETVNPSGKNIPTAGANPKSGQNPDGFYMIEASDPLASIFVVDTGSGAEFGPYASGTNIKYTEANGAKPNQKAIGGPNRAVAVHITGKGDAAVYAVNAAGDRSATVSCLVPPPPK